MLIPLLTKTLYFFLDTFIGKPLEYQTLVFSFSDFSTELNTFHS